MNHSLEHSVQQSRGVVTEVGLDMTTPQILQQVLVVLVQMSETLVTNLVLLVFVQLFLGEATALGQDMTIAQTLRQVLVLVVQT